MKILPSLGNVITDLCMGDVVGVCLTPDKTGTVHITQDNFSNSAP